MVEKVFLGHGSDITSADWHPHMSLIASGGKDRILKIWDAREDEELCSLYNHTNSICKVRFSECGQWLLTCGRDQTVRLYDVRHMERELNTYKMHDRDVLSVAWNPAYNGVFATGDSVGKVSVCSVMCSKPLSVMDHENKAEIWDICWNNMGSLLATCGGDRLINLFAPNKWIPNFKG
jgi:polyadenylation factor subunit 2